MDFVTKSYSCIREAQRLMQKHILNADLFNVLNKDAAMESLLGHAVARVILRMQPSAPSFVPK